MSPSTTLAHAQFREHFHVCAFVKGPDEERALIDPFFIEGLRRGEKAVYYVDPAQRDEHEARLRTSASSPDLVEVTTWHDAHLRGGSFDQDRMMAGLQEMIRDNAASGRPPVRLVGQMGWVFSSPPGIEQLVAYEANVNEVLNRGKTPTVCVYDVRRLSGSMMMDLLRPSACSGERCVAREPVLHARRGDAARYPATAYDELTMSGPPSNPGEDEGARRLHRCIRDLAALNALPSMCIGRSLDETLDIVVDALPTALSCDLLYLALPGSPPVVRAVLRGVQVPDGELAALSAALDSDVDADGPRIVRGAGELWCMEAAVPFGAETGRLLAGRGAPLDPPTDRVLVRSAANLVGTALENARVLEVAGRKDEFLAILGHELRNPLAPIATAVELLARHPATAREQQVIERHLRHLARLVDDLLDISRVTRGHVELRSEHVSLASVLERAVEIAAPLVSRHRHVLHVQGAEGIFLLGDPVRLAQVFGNLLVNAAKFTPPGGKLDVEVERSADRVRITVRDTGRGIAREQLARIFEPFVQANRERDALSGGLGLGLAIVKNLVVRHAGSITAHSEGPGRGAAFTVELPTVAPPVDSAAIARPQAPGARAGIRVLVVDDNVDIAELLSEALQVEGFQTAVEYDAIAAIERWRSFVPHAAVLDVGLPELDGYELARKLRAEHGTTPTLIAATGYGQRKDRLRAADAGFDCHFVKPVSVRDLVTVLDQRVVNAAARA